MIAIYARQSVDKKDSISIDTQIEIAKKEAGPEEIKVFRDKGYSGKNTNRPAFEALMKDVKNGKINKIVVYRLDRISRSIVDFADFMGSLQKYNVSFVSATEKFDTSSPMGKAMLYIIAVFAQLERETIAERITDNYYSRIKSGAVGGGKAPYGFDNGKLTVGGKKIAGYIPNENIEVVKKLFDLYAEPNTSLADLQRYLDSEGVKTATGHPWDNTKLSTLLKSPAYVRADIRIYNYYKQKGAKIVNCPEDFNGINGCVLVGKRASNTRKYNNVEDHVLSVVNHEGVIDSGTFLTVQYKLKSNRQIKNTGRGKYTWLTGLIKCNQCGYALCVRMNTTRKRKIPTFYCSGRYLYHLCDLKKGHPVSDVEDAVTMEINKYVHENGILTRKLTKEAEEKQKLYDNQIAEIDAKIELLVSSLENSSGAAINYISERINALDDERKKLLEEQQKNVEYEREQQPPQFDFSALDFDGKKRVCSLLIDKILIEEGYLKIHWK